MNNNVDYEKLYREKKAEYLKKKMELNIDGIDGKTFEQLYREKKAEYLKLKEYAIQNGIIS